MYREVSHTHTEYQYPMGMKELVSVFLLLLYAVQCFAGSDRTEKYTRTVSYAGEILVKCSGLERSVVQTLMEAEGVDVWHVGVGGTLNMRVSKDKFQAMKGSLPECREDRSIEELVRQAEEHNKRSLHKETKATWFEEYHTYADIVSWWEELAEKNPMLVKFNPSIGKSIEGRDQPAVTITDSSVENIPVIYFQCQIHAREWISGATCMYIINNFVDRFNNGSELIKVLLNQVKIIVVPFVNPDGYEYTWNVDRLWRKNRRPGPICDGVDLNRNYDDHWSESGSSSNPCSETYHGTKAESEPETQNTANFFRASGNIIGAIDWHSYSQLILRPYGWTYTDSPDEAQLKELGEQMAEDIKAVHGKTYMSIKSIDLYATSGTASDWFYSDNANENNEYRAAGFTIELRDTGQYGFLLPKDQIIPTGEEMVGAVIRFIENLQSKPLEKKVEVL